MKDEIEMLVAGLNAMSIAQLRERYAQVFGEPPRSSHRQHLVKRIAWRTQANREGGLSERARQRAAELANDADLRLTAPRMPAPAETGETVVRSFHAPQAPGLPRPGSMLRREYKERVIVVRVLREGFEFEGERYRSLTAIAKRVTGSHWNGRLFFGLRTAGKEASA